MMALLQAISEGVRSGPPDNAASFRIAYIAAAIVYGGYALHLVRRLTRAQARLRRTPVAESSR
jgi:hypothetical protein